METTQQLDNDFFPEEKRPQFLSVICILTWICSGLIFISTAWGALFPPSAEETYEKIENMRKVSPEAADKLEQAFESQTPLAKGMNSALTLIGLGLTVFGTMQLWQLKKGGFKFYLVGELIPYAGFIFTGVDGLGAIGVMSGMSTATIAAITITVMLVFDGIFIAMYAANLKHMKE